MRLSYQTFLSRRTPCQTTCYPTPSSFNTGGSCIFWLCFYKWKTSGGLCIRLCLPWGKELHLTPIEYKLLCLLCQNMGKVLTHTLLLKRFGQAIGKRTLHPCVYLWCLYIKKRRKSGFFSIHSNSYWRRVSDVKSGVAVFAMGIIKAEEKYLFSSAFGGEITNYSFLNSRTVSTMVRNPSNGT